MEIRVLMPKFGSINERRHRLHEVVRLSGMNIIIDDDDFPLIIKVASLPGARLQVYFLDNEDFSSVNMTLPMSIISFMMTMQNGWFSSVKVPWNGQEMGLASDIIHCHGWMTSLVPMYIKTVYKKNRCFTMRRWSTPFMIILLKAVWLNHLIPRHWFTRILKIRTLNTIRRRLHRP